MVVVVGKQALSKQGARPLRTRVGHVELALTGGHQAESGSVLVTKLALDTRSAEVNDSLVFISQRSNCRNVRFCTVKNHLIRIVDVIHVELSLRCCSVGCVGRLPRRKTFRVCRRD